MTLIKDLGFIQAILSSPSAPTNTQMLWYDTNVNLHKYYDTVSSSWVALAGSGQPLSVVLGVGNQTSGTPIRVSGGDALWFHSSTFKTIFETATLTADRTLQLPDKSGILATLADIAGAVGLTATLALDNITGGNHIRLSNGDKLKAVNGNASLNLRNGSDGYILLDTNDGGLESYLQVNPISGVVLQSDNGGSYSKIQLGTAAFIVDVATTSLFHIWRKSGTAVGQIYFDTSDVMFVDNAVDDSTMHLRVKNTTNYVSMITLDGQNRRVGIDCVAPDSFFNIGDGSVSMDYKTRFRGTAGYALNTEWYLDTDLVSSFEAQTDQQMKFFMNTTEFITYNNNNTGDKNITIGVSSVWTSINVSVSFSPTAVNVNKNSAVGVEPTVPGVQITGFTSAVSDKLLLITNTSTTISFDILHMAGGATQVYCPGAADNTVAPQTSRLLRYESMLGAWTMVTF